MPNETETSNKIPPIRIPKKKVDPEPQAVESPPTYYERFLAGRALPTAKEIRLTYLPPNDTIVLSLHDAGGILVGAFYVEKNALESIKNGITWLDAEQAKIKSLAKD